MPPVSSLDLFAACAPGLERIIAAELVAVGVRPALAEGGATFRGGLEQLYGANLWMRTASRIVVRLGAFHASTFHELERSARRIPWERVLTPEVPVRLRVTCRKSKLYHSDAVAQRVLGAIAHRIAAEPSRVAYGGAEAFRAARGGSSRGGGGEDDGDESADQGDTGAEAQLFTVRLLHDRCTISADSSGALLHRRGYRQATAKAPLRESLAAAMLLDSGWSAAGPLVDPFCGSGTIAIEGVMLARRIAPGLARRFAFQRWPDFDQGLWRELLERAKTAVLPRSPAPILASDRDKGAIAATAANAARVGLDSDSGLDADGDIELSVGSISDLRAPRALGWVITNPPYGVRIGNRGPLRALYSRFGAVLRRECPGWSVGLLSADPRLAASLEISLEERFGTRNGGIPVRFLAGRVEDRVVGAP